MAVRQLIEIVRMLFRMLWKRPTLQWPRGTWGDFLKRKGNPRSVSPKGCDMASHTDRGVHVLEGGEKLRNVHLRWKCQAEWTEGIRPCPIHRMTDHHMRSFPQHWRGDRRLMERICPHGVGHPDPDDPSPPEDRVHGCDGCCIPRKKVKCSGPGCVQQRKHWCEPDVPRGIRWVEVAENYNGKAYCSLTCAMLDGAFPPR